VLLAEADEVRKEAEASGQNGTRAIWLWAWGQLTAAVRAGANPQADVIFKKILHKLTPLVSRMDRNVALTYAAEIGHAKLLELLLQTGVDLAPFSWRALAAALKSRHYSEEAASILIDNGGVDVIPFAAAVRWNHPRIVKTMLDRGIDPRWRADGHFSVYVAAEEGHCEVLRLILDASARLGLQARSAAEKKAHTNYLRLLPKVVERAAERGHLKCVQELISRGLSQTAKRSMIEGAARGGHVDVINYIIGLPLTREDKMTLIIGVAKTPRRAAVDTVLVGVLPLMSQEELGELYNRASELPSDELLERIMSFQGFRYEAAQHALAKMASNEWLNHRNPHDAVKRLLAKGAEVNDIATIGVDPLMVAAQKGNARIMKDFLDGGAKLILQPRHLSRGSLAAKELLRRPFGNTVDEVTQVLDRLDPELSGEFIAFVQQKFPNGNIRDFNVDESRSVFRAFLDRMGTA